MLQKTLPLRCLTIKYESNSSPSSTGYWNRNERILSFHIACYAHNTPNTKLIAHLLPFYQNMFFNKRVKSFFVLSGSVQRVDVYAAYGCLLFIEDVTVILEWKSMESDNVETV